MRGDRVTTEPGATPRVRDHPVATAAPTRGLRHSAAMRASEPDPTRAVVTSVQGRATGPYRGLVTDDRADPMAPRAPSPPRPRDDVVAAIAGLPGVTIERTTDRLELRGPDGERLDLWLAPVLEVAVPDLRFVGNEYLAILVCEALVALFGPLRFALDGYADLIDGTEPGAATARYRAHMAAKLDALVAATIEDGRTLARLRDALEEAPSARRSRQRGGLIALAIFVLVAGVTVWYYAGRTWTR